MTAAESWPVLRIQNPPSYRRLLQTEVRDEIKSPKKLPVLMNWSLDGSRSRSVQGEGKKYLLLPGTKPQ
jgi:hypothetical protein